MPRCKACTIKGKVCKRTAACNTLCAQHLALFPTCPCCLESVVPGTLEHLQTPCGHAFHFVCAQKWTIRCESTGINTTCPTCRHPFSHCMRALLDTTAPVRHIVSEMRVIKDPEEGVDWCFETWPLLLDMSTSIYTLIKTASESQVPVNAPFTMDQNQNYVFTTQKGCKWAFLPRSNPTKAIMSLMIKINDLFARYSAARQDMKKHEEIAMWHLSRGKQLKCKRF